MLLRAVFRQESMLRLPDAPSALPLPERQKGQKEKEGRQERILPKEVNSD
jgi:hypothetical protein